MAPWDEYTHRLTAMGCRYIELPMDNRGAHPVRDALLLWRFWRLLRRERPDVYLGYTGWLCAGWWICSVFCSGLLNGDKG